MAVDSSKNALLKFACETCGASVDELCHTASGKPSYDSHAARHVAEGDYYREKVPCGRCGTPVMRSYMPPSEICTECA